MLNPQIAYQVDARTLLGSLINSDQSDLREIRSEFARYLTSRDARDATGWQDAWNRFTGATDSTAGQIAYTPNRCQTCHGRGYDTRHISRNMSRTGNPYVCGDCRGTRRGSRTTIRARFVRLPETPSVDATDATGGDA